MFVSISGIYSDTEAISESKTFNKVTTHWNFVDIWMQMTKSKCNSVNCQIIVQINWSEKSKASPVGKRECVRNMRTFSMASECAFVCSLLLYCITYWHWDMSQNMWKQSIFSTTASRLAFDSIAFGSWKAILAKFNRISTQTNLMAFGWCNALTCTCMVTLIASRN